MEFSKVLVVLCLVGFASATKCIQQHCPKTGHAVMPLVTDCSRYILCEDGAESIGTCGASFHFDAKIRACVPKRGSTCTPCSEVTPKERALAAEEEIVCKSDNGFWADLRPSKLDCGRYYVCDWGKAIPMNCPEVLHFNAKLQVCDSPITAGCEYYPESAAVSVLSRSIQPRENIPCHDENGEWADIRPSTEDCNKYYVCDWGRPIAMYCPPDMHFNPTKKVCDHPEDAGCTLAVPVYFRLQRKITRSVQCPLLDGPIATLLPDPENCESYYLCNWGVPIKKPCPDGLHFSPTLKVCEFPDKAQCEKSAQFL